MFQRLLACQMRPGAPSWRVVYGHIEYRLMWLLLDSGGHHVAIYAYVVSWYENHVVLFAGVGHHPGGIGSLVVSFLINRYEEYRFEAPVSSE